MICFTSSAAANKLESNFSDLQENLMFIDWEIDLKLDSYKHYLLHISWAKNCKLSGFS